MFGGIWKQAGAPIGLDLGAHSVRMLQLSPRGDAVQAAAWRALPVSDGPLRGEAYHEAVGQAVRAMLQEGHFTGKRVVSGLPVSAVQFKNLRLPRMPADELAAAVQWEAAERLGLGDEPVETQFFDAGEVRQGDEARQEVILMAVPTAFVEAHVQTLTDTGLHPEAIDVAPGALARCLTGHEQHELDAPARVVLDVGHSASKVLIARGGRVLFFKAIDIGGAKLDQVLADQLDLPRAEVASLRHRMQLDAAEPDEADPSPPPAQEVNADGEGGADRPLFGPGSHREIDRAVYEAVRPVVSDLARELSLCLRYYSVTFRGPRPEEVLLVGGEARQRWLAPMLAEGSGVAMQLADPFAASVPGATLAALRDAQGPEAWAVALGLAQRRPDDAAKRRAA